MQLSPWLIYLWGIADSLFGLFLAIAIVSGVTAFVVAVTIAFARSNNTMYPSLYANLDPDAVAARRWPIVRRVGICAAMFALIAALTPSSKTIAIMVVAPAIVNSEPIQKDLPEIYNLAKDALKDALAPSK